MVDDRGTCVCGGGGCIQWGHHKDSATLERMLSHASACKQTDMSHLTTYCIQAWPQRGQPVLLYCCAAVLLCCCTLSSAIYV
jgi:hypothetical protein